MITRDDFCFGPTLWIAVATNMSNCDVIHSTTHEQRQTRVSAKFHTLPGLHSIQHENFQYNCARTTTQAVHQKFAPYLAAYGSSAVKKWTRGKDTLGTRSCGHQSLESQFLLRQVCAFDFLNPPKGFLWHPLASVLSQLRIHHMTTFSWKRTHPFTAPQSAKAISGRDRVVLPENTLCVGRTSKDHVVPVTNTCTNVSVIGGKQPSPCCSSSSHGPGATAKRSIHFGFCL